MILKPVSKRQSVILQVIGLVVVIVAYTMWSYYLHLDDEGNYIETYRFVPSWAQIAKGFQRVLSVDEDEHIRYLMADGKTTLLRFAFGMSVSVFGAFILGILMGCFRRIEALCLRIVSRIAEIPATAVISIVFVAVGTGVELYVTIIAFGTFPILAEAVFLRVRDVRQEMIDKAYTLGASNGELVWNVIVRMILPRFIDDIRLQIGPALVYLIAAEYMCAYLGFGYRIAKLAKQSKMDMVFPYLLALVLFGLLLKWVLGKIRGMACPWYDAGGE